MTRQESTVLRTNIDITSGSTRTLVTLRELTAPLAKKRANAGGI
jgi:hypothetical protein